jgi:pimeloyl-ACP methyl ester carboxylesterase
VDVPETRYANSGDLQIAYQVAGGGPLDVVLVSSYLSNIELFWELPSNARFLERLSSFSRLILFDRRGSGMSDGIAGATPLEEQIDDVQAVIDAVGSEQPVLISYLEGCGLTSLFAASHPDLVRALVLVSPQPRLVAGPGYEWAPSVEQRAADGARTATRDESRCRCRVAGDDRRHGCAWRASQRAVPDARAAP